MSWLDLSAANDAGRGSMDDRPTCILRWAEMNVRIVVVLVLFLCHGSAPLSAQHLCDDCLDEAQQLLKQCLESAISEEDKKSCSERQQARSKGCESSHCMTERAARKMDKPVEQKSQAGTPVTEERRKK